MLCLLTHPHSDPASASSPASEPRAYTVGSTTSQDARSSFSNHGTCLDIFAPGSSIVSAGVSSDSSLTTKSGTSMATPHVAGVAALILSSNSSKTVDEVGQKNEAYHRSISCRAFGLFDRFCIRLPHVFPAL